MFAPPSCPLGFDFNGTYFTDGVVVEAAPTVIFGSFCQASFDGVAVDVLELFNVLLVGGDIEVVVAALPELFLSFRFQFAGG